MYCAVLCCTVKVDLPKPGIRFSLTNLRFSSELPDPDPPELPPA